MLMELIKRAQEEAEAEAEGDAEAILSDAVEEAVAVVTEEAPDAAPEEIAQAAAEILPEVVEEKTSEYFQQKVAEGRFREAGREAIGGGAAGAAVGGTLGVGVAEVARRALRDPRAAAAFEGSLPKLPKGLRTKAGLAGAGALGILGALGGAARGGVLGRQKKASDNFETAVVKEARDILASSGFDPDTGERFSKVALAQTQEEAVKVAALELLESRGWPVQWDPKFLTRATQEE